MRRAAADPCQRGRSRLGSPGRVLVVGRGRGRCRGVYVRHAAPVVAVRGWRPSRTSSTSPRGRGRAGRRRTRARHAGRIPAPTMEPPITHPRRGPQPQIRTRSLVRSGTQSCAVQMWVRSPPPGGRHHVGLTVVAASDNSCPAAHRKNACRPAAVVLGVHRRPVGFAGWGAFVVDGATPAVGAPLARAQSVPSAPGGHRRRGAVRRPQRHPRSACAARQGCCYVPSIRAAPGPAHTTSAARSRR